MDRKKRRDSVSRSVLNFISLARNKALVVFCIVIMKSTVDREL